MFAYWLSDHFREWCYWDLKEYLFLCLALLLALKATIFYPMTWIGGIVLKYIIIILKFFYFSIIKPAALYLFFKFLAFFLPYYHKLLYVVVKPLYEMFIFVLVVLQPWYEPVLNFVMPYVFWIYAKIGSLFFYVWHWFSPYLFFVLKYMKVKFLVFFKYFDYLLGYYVFLCIDYIYGIGNFFFSMIKDDPAVPKDWWFMS
jgi:hypothetical protein